MFFRMSVPAWKTRVVSYYSEWNIRHKNRKAFVLRMALSWEREAMSRDSTLDAPHPGSP